MVNRSVQPNNATSYIQRYRQGNASERRTRTVTKRRLRVLSCRDVVVELKGLQDYLELKKFSKRKTSLGEEPLKYFSALDRWASKVPRQDLTKGWGDGRFRCSCLVQHRSSQAWLVRVRSLCHHHRSGPRTGQLHTASEPAAASDRLVGQLQARSVLPRQAG